MKRTLVVIGVILAICGVIGLTLFLFFLGVTRNVTLDPQKLELDTSCIHLYDSLGERMEEPSAEPARYETMPTHLTRAFVAVEDKRFFDHKGFDYRRIVKAALKNIATFSFSEGASTISQQLIKNTHLTSEKTVSRKLKELKLTRMLEKRYTKEDILELYLNSIYFGHSAFGIGQAAYFYFEKQPQALEPAESALLAALVRSPNRYSPFKNAEASLARRNFVLKLMHEQGYLDEAAYSTALTTPLPVSPHPLDHKSFYPSLVYEELSELFPDAETGELGDLRVYTAYDPSLQETLDALPAQSDIIAIVRGNKNNAIKAIRTDVGLPKRLPASTIKPLLVYGPATEENLISPATPILDEKTNFGGYLPDDADGASGTYVSARQALAKSINIPAVKLLNALGIDRGIGYLEKMGLSVDREDRSLALALGGMREGFSLLSLADGYATLANSGYYNPSGTILRVENTRGDVLYEKSAQNTRVFSEDTAFLVTDMLKTAAKEGTARKLRSLPFDVAAKTGTNEVGGVNLDAYTIAYTTADVVGVWMGNANNRPVSIAGGGLPANAVKESLSALYAKSAPANFSAPQGVVRLSYDGEAYEKEHRLVRSDPEAPALIDPVEYFRASALPTEQSTRFTRPSIKKPQIYIKNGSVNIVLCQTEYYDYVVKRENRGTITTIYSGEFRTNICDNSVQPGESYLYTVIPYYRGNEGTAAVLPRVQISAPSSLPDEWWE